ncbi:MAG: hypothetical protein U0894_13615 [Pirellulales bacterium]
MCDNSGVGPIQDLPDVSTPHVYPAGEDAFSATTASTLSEDTASDVEGFVVMARRQVSGLRVLVTGSSSGIGR